MSIIKIKIENNNKTFNERSLKEIINGFEKGEFEYENIMKLFEKINSEKDLIKELKTIKKYTTPISILIIIKALGNLSISEANPILEKVLED
ncbi:hypothetical protein KORDIASMS9_01991 [Kordia sp. SMS9]|uniref:hypothetical protein n=1 Tax=Kordia sp. SMS9 TaxID=2282170 RepID=UPI000E0D438C|nr:hypothetical protein [Kordia sp. SMS9]AXG69764.1 hypothetical protein KORDIASMS9_01991 [Kordia sp. SMS9]